MDLRQLRSFAAVCDTELNVSRAAESLHLVQPAVSAHLKHLESQIGSRLFVRNGRRLVGLTHAGERVLHHARRLLAEAASLQAATAELAGHHEGRLRIATTHTQARYVLPAVIRSYRERYPSVDLELHQAAPDRLAAMALEDRVDLAIGTEALADTHSLTSIPCHRWQHCLIAPQDHPILARRPISLELLCEYPMVTYVAGFTGRSRFHQGFAREGLRPRVVLAAADSDVIKCYVREGLGIGVIAELALERGVDDDLAVRGLGHLFPAEVTRIAYPSQKYLRECEQGFIERFQLSRGDSGRRGSRDTAPRA